MDNHLSPMKKSVGAILFASVILSLIVWLSSLRRENSPYLTVGLAKSSSSNCVLRFQLKHNGYESIKIEAADLPWYAAEFVIVDVSGNRGVVPKDKNEGLMIRDFAGITTLSRGDLIEETVNLAQLYYADAVIRNRQSDLVLFWTYQLKTIDGKLWPRVSGSIHLEKTVAKL